MADCCFKQRNQPSCPQELRKTRRSPGDCTEDLAKIERDWEHWVKLRISHSQADTLISFRTNTCSASGTLILLMFASFKTLAFASAHPEMNDLASLVTLDRSTDSNQTLHLLNLGWVVSWNLNSNTQNITSVSDSSPTPSFTAVAVQTSDPSARQFA
ncbi:hypothetical protein CROQUDRAFT_98397 [Cronartium quercuum f. sp. fusiforme G11]|uniref:Uncharacterized protein n=1 Tax=Cronartium quercuum f. sp. fusiforme G11 TaxID=708437 RepID=A0A9P6T7Q6_9BASI|nr:hypothetical protein CROQUDRAFT_98397 [Cronartium quercuum f. sp. fusiforme G11]